MEIPVIEKKREATKTMKEAESGDNGGMIQDSKLKSRITNAES
jgi:hypothetical protein